LKENGIPLDAIIAKQPGSKGPNREIRRKMTKLAAKNKSKQN